MNYSLIKCTQVAGGLDLWNARQLERSLEIWSIEDGQITGGDGKAWESVGVNKMLWVLKVAFLKTFVSDCFYRLVLSYSPIVSRYAKTNLFFGKSI